MENIWKTILVIMDTIIMIAPNLREILSTILKKSNSSKLSLDQLKLLSPDLEEFEDKIFALASFFKISEFSSRVAMIGPDYTSENVHQGVETWMKMIDLINKAICKRTFIPLFASMLLCKSPSSQIQSEFHSIESVKVNFQISLKINKMIPVPMPIPENTRMVLNIIHDGKLVLSRMYPSRKFAMAGTVQLRDLKGHLKALDHNDLRAYRAFDGYNIKVVMKPLDISSPFLVHLEPRIFMFTEEICQKVYNKECYGIEIFDLYDLDKNELLSKDECYGPRALWNKIAGSSITSLDSTLVLLGLFCDKLMVDEKAYPGFSKHLIRSLKVTDAMSVCSFDHMREMVNAGMSNEKMCEYFDRIISLIEMMEMGITYFGLGSSEIEVIFGKGG